MDQSFRQHNLRGIEITVELRLFNSLTRFSGSNGMSRYLKLPAGSTLGDILKEINIPVTEIYLAMRNGRDVTRSLYTDINVEAVLDDGDVVALSGPVPYSWGYGAPVV